MAAAAQETAQVISFSEQRRAKREHEQRQELRRLGIHTRELVLMQRESLMESAAHWYRRWQTARFLNGRMLMLLNEANKCRAESERLLAEARAECERLRGML